MEIAMNSVATGQTPLTQILINLLSDTQESKQQEIYKALTKKNLEF